MLFRVVISDPVDDSADCLGDGAYLREGLGWHEKRSIRSDH